MRHGVYQKIATLMAVAAMCASSSALATTIWSFGINGSASTNSGSTYGNVRTFTEGGETVAVTAWSDTGSPPPDSLQVAYLGQYSTGLGVCNTAEAAMAGSLGACASDGGVRDQVDNVGNQDLVLFVFDTPRVFESVSIDPYGEFDRDVSFWIGNVSLPVALSGLTFADLAALGFGAQQDSFNGIGGDPLSISLGNVVGNALLVGALVPPNGDNDKFKIHELATSAVPLPATIWLFLAGFGMLLGRLRRRSRR